MSNVPTRDEIEVRAYEIYLERGAEHGHDVEDWAQAEQELLGLDAQGLAEDAAPQHKTAAAGRQGSR